MAPNCQHKQMNTWHQVLKFINWRWRENCFILKFITSKQNSLSLAHRFRGAETGLWNAVLSAFKRRMCFGDKDLGARTGDSAQCRATSPNTSRCTVQQSALYNSDGVRCSPTFHLAPLVWTPGHHSGSVRVASNDKCAPVKIPSSRWILQGQRIKSHSVNKQPRSWLVWSSQKNTYHPPPPPWFLLNHDIELSTVGGLCQC